MAICNVCHNRCNLEEGALGACRARKCIDGKVICTNYGLITSMALDPIEKKPLRRFYPRSNILSVGSFGCNLRCPYCQNHQISYGFKNNYSNNVRKIGPKELAEAAYEYKSMNNIGVAFTYNEPLVGYEYVIDAAKEVHNMGMKSVLVSNGCVSGDVALEVVEHIDAMNIDLKGFTGGYYSNTLGGNLDMVMEFIKMASLKCHVEVTTLIVPSYNDKAGEIAELAKWLASLKNGKGKTEIVLHLSRYFPRFNMLNIPATNVEAIYKLKDVAEQYLDNVYTGNC